MLFAMIWSMLKEINSWNNEKEVCRFNLSVFSDIKERNDTRITAYLGEIEGNE